MSDTIAPPSRGDIGQQISTRVVAIFKEHLGRGPTKARTTVTDDVVLCLLEDSLIKAEQSLVQAGKSDTVRSLRRELQDTMKAELCEAVEVVTGRAVIAFMSANHVAPDYMSEIFVLGGPSAGASAAAREVVADLPTTA